MFEHNVEVEVPYLKASSVRFNQQIMSLQTALYIARTTFYKFPDNDFICICLNKSNEVVCISSFGRCSTNDIGISCKDVLKFAVQYNATAIKILHKVVGYKMSASEELIKIARYIKGVAGSMQIQCFDFIIINSLDEEYISFSKDGLLKEVKFNVQ